MSLQIRAFRPLANTQITNVTASSQTVVLNYLHGVRSLRLVNYGPDIIYIECRSDSANTTATTASVAMLPNTVEVFTITLDVQRFSVLGMATTSVLYSTVGEGL